MARLPNLLTLFRIALIPLLVWLLTDLGERAAVLATLTFFLACLSDFFDGYLARRHGITTTLGKFLDPMADKLIVMAALVMLASMQRVAGWVVVIIVGRELAVTGLRAIASGEGIVLGADELGKYKMIFQMFALHGLLLHYRFIGVDFHAAGLYFLWISIVISAWSAVAYHLEVARTVARGRG